MEGEKWSNQATRSGSSSPLSLHTTGEPPIFTVAGIACKSGGLQELRLPAISLPVMDSLCFRRGVARLPLPQTRNKGGSCAVSVCCLPDRALTWSSYINLRGALGRAFARSPASAGILGDDRRTCRRARTLAGEPPQQQPGPGPVRARLGWCEVARMVSNGWYSILRTPRACRNSPNHQCARSFFGRRGQQTGQADAAPLPAYRSSSGPPSTMKFDSHCW